MVGHAHEVPVAEPLLTEMEVQCWPEGTSFSAPGRQRWPPVLEQPLGRIHLAGDYLGARGVDTELRARAQPDAVALRTQPRGT